MSTSRRDHSLRADARARYRQAALEAALAGPPPVGPSLTEAARRLYEDAIVPVREIALICGVSERTIYKYAHKGLWRRRGPSATKGAGGRFISHTQAGEPVARGLKATDPKAVASAVEASRHAAALARQALEAAWSARDARANRYAVGHLAQALSLLFRVELGRGPRPAAPGNRKRSRRAKLEAAWEAKARARWHGSESGWRLYKQRLRREGWR